MSVRGVIAWVDPNGPEPVEALLPCPFCGYQAIPEVSTERLLEIRCPCGVKISRDKPGLVIAAWNRRALRSLPKKSEDSAAVVLVNFIAKAECGCGMICIYNGKVAPPIDECWPCAARKAMKAESRASKRGTK